MDAFAASGGPGHDRHTYRQIIGLSTALSLLQLPLSSLTLERPSRAQNGRIANMQNTTHVAHFIAVEAAKVIYTGSKMLGAR
jgi:hypothetical protein